MAVKKPKETSEIIKAVNPMDQPLTSKFCTKCKTEKCSLEFYKSKKTKDGLYRICKDCKKASLLLEKLNSPSYQKEYRERNRDSIALAKKNCFNNKKEVYLEKKKEYYEKNKEKLLLQMLSYRERNKEKISQQKREDYCLNKEKYLQRVSNRRIAQERGISKLLDESGTSKIKEIYQQCKYLCELFDQSFHVDHIVPLNGKNVCGLHVPWNLQILPAVVNLAKGNRFKDE